MATNKENLALWLMVDALLKNNKYDELQQIASKMIQELEDHKESKEKKKKDA